MPHKLAHYPVTHGGIRKVIHPHLKVEIDNQTAIKYLRFIEPVKIERLELPRSLYGRWAPGVPTHPAHLLVSVPDTAARRWRLVKEVNLPYDPRTAGEGLRQQMGLETLEEHFAAILNDPPYRIDLDGLETDLLRVECDREHPVWPNHGECNGSPYSVPFGILDPLNAYGEGAPPYTHSFQYRPGLQMDECCPAAPDGMTIRQTRLGLFYESPRFSIGFSLRRPLLMHLGWDAMGSGQPVRSRLKADWAIGIGSQVGGLSGPLLKTFTQDFGAQHWTGKVSVQGNVVEYRRLQALDGLVVSARFTMDPDGATLDLVQTCTAEVPVLEAETWRMVWDLRQGMTGTVGVPILAPGRNGEVGLPLVWASDGAGCLVCAPLPAQESPWIAQVESYRSAYVNTCGLRPVGELAGMNRDAEAIFCLKPGESQTTLRLQVDQFEPRAASAGRTAGEGLRRHWGSVFSCFRPEHRGFSNNAASVNCHLSQMAPVEVASATRSLSCGLDPADLSRFTLKRALLDGGGYGYWRNLYLDSDPVLLIAAGRLHQASPSLAWLRSVEPGLSEITRRMLANRDERGLILCRDLSGNSGSYRWSCNSMDVIGFGHLDAYVNALSYRALRCAAALFNDLEDTPSSARCREAAARIKTAYAPEFLNPATGWLAGWRSQDGQLHDYGFIWVNAPAIAFGLLEPEQARQALLNLEALRAKSGTPGGYFGLPGNLLPIAAGDHMMPLIWGVAQPTFENYTDGGTYGFNAGYYLRALSIYGLKEQAARLAAELEEGFAAGYFNGGMGTGAEFRSWEGLRTGYEGTLIGSFGPVYGLAIQQGLISPPEPEWWPAGG